MVKNATKGLKNMKKKHPQWHAAQTLKQRGFTYGDIAGLGGFNREDFYREVSDKKLIEIIKVIDFLERGSK